MVLVLLSFGQATSLKKVHNGIKQLGMESQVQWPTGIGAPGNEGVANAIKGTANTIGYVELAYALTTKMPYAYLQNKAGKFIEPTLESTKAAAAAVGKSLPAGDKSWESVSLINAPGADTYPIASLLISTSIQGVEY